MQGPEYYVTALKIKLAGIVSKINSRLPPLLEAGRQMAHLPGDAGTHVIREWDGSECHGT